MIKSITLVILLLSTPALACETFEECMAESKKYDAYNVGMLSIHGEQAYYEVKALAYKLDEISKKLDKESPKITPATKLRSLSGSYCKEDEVGWDGKCHKGDMDEFAYSKECAPPIIGNPTWKKIENAYGPDDKQITYRKPGCYDLRIPKND